MATADPTTSAGRSVSRRWLRRLYTDDRGNLGILLLLTIWALVLLVAMVWNTGEYATRRRHAQTAADSAAQTASLWIARTTNLTTSANLVMSQNGSAEVILRSIVPTRDQIQTRLDREGDRTRQLQHGSRQREPEQGVPDCEYFEELIGFGAWAGNGRGQQRQQEFQNLVPDINRALQRILPLLQPQQAQQLSQSMQDALSQNQIAVNWILNTYIGLLGGGGPATPPTTPPGFTPVGQPVSDWITGQVRTRLTDILRTLEVEQSWHDRWISQTAPALATTPEQLREVRFEIFDYEQQIADLTPDAIMEQHEALSEFYEVQTATSVPGRISIDPSRTAITAPVAPAVTVSGESRIDSIRQRYPDATARRFGSSSPQVWIDPINVNVEQSEIWHPGFSVPVTGITLEEQTYSGWLSVGGGSWGRVPCAPLNRYLNDRVYRDREGLRAEPRAIDQERSALRGRIYPPPQPPTIEPLPQQIDDVNDAEGNPIRLPPRQIPTLPLPPELTDAERTAIEALNDQIREYNRLLRDYVNDLRGLGSAAERMHANLSGHSDSATRRFADQAWLNHVDRNRDLVLRLMGGDKQFMVLETYKLRDIPDWAEADMRQDVYRHVYNLLMSRSRSSATQRLIRQLEQWAIGVLNASTAPGDPGRNTIRARARRFAQQYGPPAAENATRRAADTIAREVASEWVRRPWPYEIEPPNEPVPPTRGISDEERKRYFTSLSACLTTGDTTVRPLMDKYFNQDTGPMVAFAQSDIFNWMEFDEGYGAGDRYDRITFYGHGDMGGSPRPWRLGSPGGWNWEPRLSLTDSLPQAISGGIPFRDLINAGGVTTYGHDDESALDTLTSH